MLSYPFDEFGKPLAQALRETPQPTGSEVVVRVGSCGLCHSDVHLHEGYFDLGNGQKLDLSRGIAPPRVLGHEIAGTVVAVGPDASGVAVGDRRVVFPWIGCTACGPCKQGHEELCMAPRALGINRDGGFADHVLVPHPRYLFAYDPLPEAAGLHLRLLGPDRLQRAQEMRAARRRRHAAHHRRRRCRPVGRAHGGGGTRRQAGRGRDRSRQMGYGPRCRRRRLPGPRRCGSDQGLHEGQPAARPRRSTSSARRRRSRTASRRCARAASW